MPYFKEFITSEHTAGRCKSFGDQVCVVVVDTWWGWLEGKAKKHRASAEFKSWLTKTYPWIRLIYVPAGCTPVAQPMDAGIIAKLKALLRKRYQAWVIKQTVDQITSGKDPSEIIIPSDVPTCKKNTFRWLSEVCAELNSMPRSNITHCWDTTKLTEAWTHDVQAEAASRVKELFPNLVQGNTLMPHWGRATAVSSSHDEAPETEDDDASWGGLPFLQPPDGMAEDEWIDFVRHYESEYISDLPVADVIS